MTTTDPDSTQTSRNRLLNAGKTLFAKNGYEQTSTAAIAREAGSSESQLIRYFGGKAGLLEAIFNESWVALNDAVQQRITDTDTGRDAILKLVSLMIAAFSHDHDIAFLFLFEGRRMRGGSHEVVLSRGFMKFMEVVVAMIEKGRQDGSFRPDIPSNVLCSALLGCAEGMIRDRVLAERNSKPDPFTDEDIVKAFTALVKGLGPSDE